MNLADVRLKLAAALAPVEVDDPNVYDVVVDALEPPALMVVSAEPWLEPQTSCLWWCRPAVVCVAGRLEPGAGVEALEDLVAYVIDRTKADDTTWPVLTVTTPRRFDVGGITYLGARVTFRLPVTIGGA